MWVEGKGCLAVRNARLALALLLSDIISPGLNFLFSFYYLSDCTFYIIFVFIFVNIHPMIFFSIDF